MVHIPTARTQGKVAELLHDLDGCQHGNGSVGLDTCSGADEYTVRSAFFLGKLMPSISMEMFPAIRDDMRERIHDKIVAELVCCKIYEELEAIGNAMDQEVLQWTTPRDLADEHGLHFHHLCYYGAWAASLALNECPSGQRRCDQGVDISERKPI